MAIQSWKSLAMLLILAAGDALAEQPNVEELPPPVAKSVLAKETLEGDSAEAGEGAATTTSWGIYGPHGRLYCVGDLAIVDYLREGQRYIVALAEEDPARPCQNRPQLPLFPRSRGGSSLGDRPADADRWNLQPVFPGSRRAG